MDTESETNVPAGTIGESPTGETGTPNRATRKLVRNTLLVLVAGSLVYMAVKEFSDRHQGSSGASASPTEVGATTKLIVYYFAEGKDCATCENLPVFTKQALDTGFSKELASGEIVWRPLNVDEKRNEHFVTDYSLYTKSVVLVRVEHGATLRWKNLESIWDLVYDKAAFMKYIQEQTREFLDAAP